MAIWKTCKFAHTITSKYVQKYTLSGLSYACRTQWIQLLRVKIRISVDDNKVSFFGEKKGSRKMIILGSYCARFMMHYIAFSSIKTTLSQLTCMCTTPLIHSVHVQSWSCEVGNKVSFFGKNRKKGILFWKK